MAEIIRNLMYAVSFGCGLVGFLVICKQIASVREADRQKKAFYAGNPRAIVYPPPPHDWEAEARLLQVRVSDLEVDLVNLTHDLEDAKQGNDPKKKYAWISFSLILNFIGS